MSNLPKVPYSGRLQFVLDCLGSRYDKSTENRYCNSGAINRMQLTTSTKTQNRNSVQTTVYMVSLAQKL